MTSPLLSALREARASLAAIETVEPGEAAVARRLTRELDEAIARLDGTGSPRDLVSIVCHDLRDPLASIVMGAGFLKKTVPATEGGARRVVDAISRSAERMTQVVGDFHDLAKLEGGLLQLESGPCDVVAAVRGGMAALQAQAADKGVALEVEAAPERLPATCDRTRLLQVMSKLVGNALKFTPASGRVVVVIEEEPAWVRISVKDTGRGIALDRLATIFDHAANARRSPRDGPGLGLAIARGLVELQGGELTVQSREGEGSTFAFTLPRA
jgi:signal transduction histidine kinase